VKTYSSVLNPLADVERKRSSEVDGQLITVNVNMKVFHCAQQQNLEQRPLCCFTHHLMNAKPHHQ